MEWLFDLLDLPTNLQRGLSAVRGLRGLAAGIMAVVLLCLCWLLWPWLWYFDIESTAVWSQAALDTLGGTLHGAALPWGDSFTSNMAWFVTGTTFLPSIIELFAVRFASAGIKAARVLVLFFATFDMVTDWPRVSEFVDAYNVTGLVGILLKLPLLVLASFGLESLFIIFAVCAVACLLSSRAQVQTGKRSEVRHA